MRAEKLAVRYLVAALLVVTALCGRARAQTFPADNAWTPFACGNVAMNDPVRDQSGAIAERDIVGTPQAPAGFRAADTGFLYLRLRLDENPQQGNALRPFAWGFAFSTDTVFSTYEVLATVDGATSNVQLFRNTTTTVLDSPEDPADTPAFRTYSFATHGRTIQAESSLGGNRDHFLDLALPWTDLEMIGLRREGVVAVWAASSTNADRLNGDFACHDGRDGSAVPRLTDADSDPQRTDGTGGTGGSSTGGAGGGSTPSAVSIEGGPGCGLGGDGGPSTIWMSLLALGLLALCRRR